WNYVDYKDSFWYLPAAQGIAAKSQKIAFAYSGRSQDARRYFFIAQSCACRPAEHDGLPHSLKTQQMRFYLHRVHFFPSDVNYVRNPAHDLERRIVSREQIIRNKNAIAKLPLIGLGKIAVAHR